MKITADPKKLRSMLESMFLPKVNPVFNPIILKCVEEGITSVGIDLNSFLYYHFYSKSYFKEYTDIDTEPFAISYIFLDRLKWGFKGDDILIKKDGNKLSLDDKKDHYDRETDNFEEPKVKLQIEQQDYGFAPKGTNLDTAVVIDVAELKFPKADVYKFKMTKSGLTLIIPGEGNFSRQLECKEILGKKGIEESFPSDSFDNIVSHISGEVTLIFANEDALIPTGTLIINEKTDEYTKTYILSPHVK